MKRNETAFAVFIVLISLLLASCGTSQSTPQQIDAVKSDAAESGTAVEVIVPQTHEVDGIPCFYYCGTSIPAALGFPHCDEETVAHEDRENITCYADALAFIKPTFNKACTSELVSTRISELIAGDYEDSGILILCGKHEYYMVYILADGHYYALDPYNSLNEYETEWLSEFKEKKTAGSDLKELGSLLMSGYGENPEQIKYESYLTHKREVLFETASGTMCFVHANAQIPLATGMPKLTDEEIDELIESEDYALIAEKITTLADCVNYFVRADFCYGDGIIKPAHTTSSAHQTMQRRVGQCAAMSTCMNYLLWGDYDETGYIMVKSHIMFYILNDGVYYAINPVNYARDEAFVPVGRFIKYYPETRVGSSTDFNDIAEGLREDFKTDFVYTGSWGYSFSFGIDSPSTYPAAMNPVAWIGKLHTCKVDLTKYQVDYFTDPDKIVNDEGHYIREGLPYYRGW